MHLRTLSVNINFKYELKFNYKVVFIDGYPSNPAINLCLVEFSKVSTERTGRCNKNYIAFIKSSKISGKNNFAKNVYQFSKRMATLKKALAEGDILDEFDRVVFESIVEKVIV